MNKVIQDSWVLKREGPVEWAKQLLVRSRVRPPGYRLLALPVSLLGVPGPRALRLAALLSSMAALWFAFLMFKGTDYSVAWFVIGFVGLSPGWLAWTKRFMTEAPLFLGTIASIFFLRELLVRRDPPIWVSCGYGVAIAIGAVSKITFFGFLLPSVTVVVGLDLALRARFVSWKRLFQGLCLGSLLMSPYYVLNWAHSLSYLRSAQAFTAHHSQKQTLAGRMVEWTVRFASFNLGPILLTVLLLLAATIGWTLLRGRRRAVHPDLLLALGLLSSVAILSLLHVHSRTLNHRFTTLVVFPLLFSIVLLLLWLDGWKGFVKKAALVLILLQSILLLVFLLLEARHSSAENIVLAGMSSAVAEVDQWDWDALYLLFLERESSPVAIGILGSGESFNQPQIEYPWLKRGEKATVHSLWSIGDDSIDWREILERVEEVDVVMTIPAYEGWAPRQNVHNDSLVEHLARRPDFGARQSLVLGGDEPVAVSLFWRLPSERMGSHD